MTDTFCGYLYIMRCYVDYGVWMCDCLFITLYSYSLENLLLKSLAYERLKFLSLVLWGTGLGGKPWDQLEGVRERGSWALDMNAALSMNGFPTRVLDMKVALSVNRSPVEDEISLCLSSCKIIENTLLNGDNGSINIICPRTLENESFKPIKKW